MKTPDKLLIDIRRRLENTWAAVLAAEATANGPPASPTCGMDSDREPTVSQLRWPHAFPLGPITSASAGSDFTAVVAKVALWRDWASTCGIELRWESRRILGTPQQIPTHLLLNTVDAAAGLCGGDWVERLARGRARAVMLATRYPHLASLHKIVAAVDAFTDVDFDLLCRASDWFATHNAQGMTPRQVPIEGLHAKWLNTRQHLVRDLAGVTDLGLAPSHPPRLHFTYLDPHYRATGDRLHDSATVGDNAAPAYPPRIVLVSENKDTAIHFPELPGGISVEGVGRGGSTAAAFPWLTAASAIFYWGDMDVDGLEILNEFRRAGVPAESVLMDVNAYEAWERYGTNIDAQGRLMQARPIRPVPYLTKREAALHEQLTDPAWTRYRRIEQERIPLTVARREVMHLLGRAPTGNSR